MSVFSTGVPFTVISLSPTLRPAADAGLLSTTKETTSGPWSSSCSKPTPLATTCKQLPSNKYSQMQLLLQHNAIPICALVHVRSSLQGVFYVIARLSEKHTDQEASAGGLIRQQASAACHHGMIAAYSGHHLEGITHLPLLLCCERLSSFRSQQPRVRVIKLLQEVIHLLVDVIWLLGFETGSKGILQA